MTTYDKNLKLATAFYRRYCLFMDAKNYQQAKVDLGWWFKVVEVTLNSMEKESIKK